MKLDKVELCCQRKAQLKCQPNNIPERRTGCCLCHVERERATERGRHPDNNVELIREDKDMSHRWIYTVLLDVTPVTVVGQGRPSEGHRF